MKKILISSIALMSCFITQSPLSAREERRNINNFNNFNNFNNTNRATPELLLIQDTIDRISERKDRIKAIHKTELRILSQIRHNEKEIASLSSRKNTNKVQRKINRLQRDIRGMRNLQQELEREKIQVTNMINLYQNELNFLLRHEKEQRNIQNHNRNEELRRMQEEEEMARRTKASYDWRHSRNR